MSKSKPEPEVIMTIEYRIELQYVLDNAMEGVMDKLRELGAAKIVDVNVAHYAPPTVEAIIKRVRLS